MQQILSLASLNSYGHGMLCKLTTVARSFENVGEQLRGFDWPTFLRFIDSKPCNAYAASNVLRCVAGLDGIIRTHPHSHQSSSDSLILINLFYSILIEFDSDTDSSQI